MAAVRSVDPEPGALVERFSWELEARQRTETDMAEYDQLRLDVLAQRDRRARDRNRDVERLEDMFKATRSDDVVIFDKARRQLLDSMKKFQDLVPGARTDKVPTCWDDVVLATTQVQSQWEARAKDSRAGRARELVRRMCNGMNNHATALKMLPTESEYASIVGGSVLMIVKAAANHINISEAFAKGMVEINDAVKLENLSHVYDTPILKQLTMRLYAQIFSYLIKFMTWYTDHSVTRLLKSFNETALRLFDEDLTQVKQISSLLSRQIQLHMSADVRVSKLMLEDLSGDIRYLLRFSEIGERQSRIRDAANAELLRGIVRCEIEKSKDEVKECMLGVMSSYSEMVRSEISGGGMTSLLEQQVAETVQGVRQPSAAHADDGKKYLHKGATGTSEAHKHSGLTPPQVSEVEGTENRQHYGIIDDINGPALSVADMRFESRHFEDYFTWEHVHPHLETPAPVLADAAFVARLNAFTTTLQSQFLYAHGQFHSQGPDVLQQSVAAYRSLALEAGVPVVSYFCELSHDDPPANRTRESVELSALLYAMIRQMINLLPARDSDTAFVFDDTRLSGLDGTLRTWRDALGLLENLVDGVRLPLLLFVIHGLNILEDVEGSTTRALEDLVTCFARIAGPTSDGEETIVKILFTTSGVSEALFHFLDEECIIACDSSSPRAGKRSRRARQVVSYQ